MSLIYPTSEDARERAMLTQRAHSTPDPDDEPPPPNPNPDDVPPPTHAPVREPTLPEPPIRAHPALVL
jgi:hypothetical protein